MRITTRYMNERDCGVEKCYYDKEHTRLALRIFNAGNEGIMTATINLPDEYIAPNEVFIKDYSENEGILEELIRNGVIKDTGRVVVAGHVHIHVCEVLFDEQWIK